MPQESRKHVGRRSDLAGRGGIAVLQGVGPDHQGKTGAFLVVRRQVKRSRKRHAVVTLVLDQLLFIFVSWGTGSWRSVSLVLFSEGKSTVK